MKIRILIALLLCVVLLTVIMGSYVKGRSDVWNMEYKTYEENLITLKYFETNKSPELSDFMKARYYYLANKLSRSLLGSPYDFGPVGTNAAHLGIGKGPTTPLHEYELFKKKNIETREPKP